MLKPTERGTAVPGTGKRGTSHTPEPNEYGQEGEGVGGTDVYGP